MKKAQVLMYVLLSAIVSVLFGGFVGQVTASPVTGHVVSAVMFAGSFVPLDRGVALNGLNIAELVAKLGAYCQEHRDVLVAESLLSQDLANRFEVMDGVTDEVPLPNLSISDIIKPADPVNFTPTANALSFGARVLKVRGIKVDLQLIPQVLEKTWLGKMKKPTDPVELPFEKFIMDYIAAKIKENMILQAVYNGVYNAAGTNAISTMNGYLKIIADEITAGNIVPHVTGAITSDNVIDKLELVYDGLGETYKGVPTEMKVNSQIFDWYNRKYRSAYGANNNYEGMKQGRILLDGTNCEIVREPGLATSQRIITSIKENLVYGCDSVDSFTMDIQKFDRSLKILIDFKGGVEFKEVNSRALSVNDQA